MGGGEYVAIAIERALRAADRSDVNEQGSGPAGGVRCRLLYSLQSAGFYIYVPPPPYRPSLFSRSLTLSFVRDHHHHVRRRRRDVRVPLVCSEMQTANGARAYSHSVPKPASPSTPVKLNKFSCALTQDKVR